MELKLIKAGWGMEGNWEDKIKRIANAGYQGIETWMPTKEDESLFKELLDEYKLDLIVQIYSGSDNNKKPYPDLANKHIESYERQVERALTFKPLFINSHSSKDSMDYGEQIKFFERAIQVEKQSQVLVGHETHRGRAMFTPWTTAQLLKDLPELNIVADFSHWCNVCESILPDQEENLDIAQKHTIHIHGRVGYEQGPQVPDFRASEYEYTLFQHEEWWDKICEYRKSEGKPFLTFTPEFGPSPYMHSQPFTKQPVVDLWDICFAMGNRFQEYFNNKFN